MASRHEIVTIDFRANAAKANPAMESLRLSAKDCRTEIERLDKEISHGIDTGMSKDQLEKLGKELSVQEKKLRSFETAMSTLSKGVGTLARAIDAFNSGSLNQMSAAFQKAAYNAAEVAKKALSPLSETYAKDMAELDALQQKNLENMAKYKLRTEQMLKSIGEGGKISSSDLKQEADGIKELMQLLPHMSNEWQEYNTILTQINNTVKQQADAEQRLKGAIVDANDARERARQLTRDGAEAAARESREAEKEVSMRNQIIDGLKKEREEKAKQVSTTAALVQAKDEDIKKQEKKIASIQKEIDNEKKNAEAKQKSIDKLKQEATTYENTAKANREAVGKMREEVNGLDEELKKANEDLAKMGEPKQGATATVSAKEGEAKASESVTVAKKDETTVTKESATAKEKESKASKENATAKEQEAKAGEKITETQKKEALSLEELGKKQVAIVAEINALIKERDELTLAQEKGTKAIEAEAAAAEKEANAFKNLGKEQAEALLKQKQALATITKGADGKISYTNAEEAQNFLIETIGSVNPKGKSANALSLEDDAQVAKVRTMFKERYGIADDADVKDAIKGLLSSEHGGLIKGGMMNNFFSRIDLDPTKVAAYTKEIKDLTEVVKGETKATEGESQAKKELEETSQRLATVLKQIDEKTEESLALHKLRRSLMAGEGETTDELTKKTEHLSEANKKNAESVKEQIEAIKKMSAEEAKASLAAMTKVSTVGYKEGKLDMSNPQEVQSWIIARMRERAVPTRDGRIAVSGSDVDSILSGFQSRYGWTGDKKTAKDLLREIIQGRDGGLLKEGGVVDYNVGTLMIKQNNEEYARRVTILKELVAASKGVEQITAKSTETTKKDVEATDASTKATEKETDAIKKQIEEVERRRLAYEKANKDYEEKNDILKRKRSARSRLPISGLDAQLARHEADEDIKDYNENTGKPARADKATAKKLWEQSAKILLDMQQKSTDAENKEAEATEKTTKSKRGKKKAIEEVTAVQKESNKVEEESVKSGEKLSAEDQKRLELQKKKQELESQRSAKLDEINKKEDEADGLEVKANNNRSEALKKTNELANAHGNNAEKMKKESEVLEKLQGEQKVHADQLNKERTELDALDKEIDENAEARVKAEQKKAQAQKLTIDAMNDAIKVLEAENRAIEPQSAKWNENTRVIQQYKAEIDRLKNQPVLQMMTERLGNIKNLSNDALAETKKFWQAMYDGADRGSHKIDVAAGSLRMLVEEERQRNQELQVPMRERLSKVGRLSTADLAETKKYWESRRDSLDQYVEDGAGNLVENREYRKAVLATRTAENEENRRKAHAQAQLINEQMQSLNTLSAQGLADVKRYWQAMADGAKVGSDELKDAEAALQRINKLESGRSTEALKSSAERLNGNLGNLSHGDLRQAIEDAKKFQLTLSSTSKEAQELSKRIVEAEDFVRRYGVEAERAARKQEEADKRAARAARDKADADMLAAQQERTEMMQRSLESRRKTLSAEALAETKKYWEAVAKGAEEGSVAQRNALTIMERITAEEQRRANIANEKLASKLGGNLSDMSEGEIRQSIEAGKQLIQTYKSSSAEAEALAKNIVAAEEHVKQYGVEAQRAAVREAEALKKAAQQRQENDALMKQQLQQGTQLSESALRAQVQYWQRLIDDPKTAAASLQEYKNNLQQANTTLEKVVTEEKQLSGSVVTVNDALRLSRRLSQDAMDQRLRLAQTEKQEATEARKAIEASLENNLQRIETAERELPLIEEELAKRKELAAVIEKAGKLRHDLGTAKDERHPFAQDYYKEKDEWLKLNDAEIKAQVKVDDLKEKLDNTSDTRNKRHVRKELRDAEVELTQAREKSAAQAEKLKLAEEKLAQADEKVTKVEKELSAVMGGLDYDTEKEKLDDLTAKHKDLVAVLGKEKGERESLANAVTSAQEREKQASIELAQAENATQKSVEDAIVILEKAQKNTAQNTLEYNEQAEALTRLKERLGEMTGTMMKLADAQKLAGQADIKSFSKEDSNFLATPEQLQQSVQALTRYKDTLIQTIRKKREAGNATKDEEAELEKVEKQLKDLKFEQDNYNMSHKKMMDLLKEPKKAEDLDELRAAIKRADGELKRMKNSLGENSKEYQEYAQQVKNAKIQLGQMEQQSKATASAFAKAWSRLKTYVGLYVGAAVAMQKIVATMGDLMELSDKMGEVRKTTGFTADEVGRLTTNLARIDTRSTLVQLEELAASAGQLGLKTTEDVEGFTIAANKLMVALPEMGREGATQMLKVALATGEIDRIRKQMQDGTVEGSSAVAVAMEKVGSTIDRLRASSASAAPAITDFVQRVGAVGAQSGISIDQIAALGSTVDALGMRVEMSATALSRMIPAIKNNAFDIAKAIGVTPDTLRNLFETGRGMEAILMIFQRIKDSGMDADSIENMLGMGNMKEIMKELNQQGARAGIVFAGLSQNVDELRRQLGVASQAYEENISIQQEYNKMNETTAAKWERLKNRFEEMFVGDTGQRWLGGIIDALRDVVELLAGDSGVSIILRSILVYMGLVKLQIISIAKGALVALGSGLKNIGVMLGFIKGEMTAIQWGNIFTALIAAVWLAVDAFQRARDEATRLKEDLNRLKDEEDAAVAEVNRLITALNDSASKSEAAGKKHEELAEKTEALRKDVEELKKETNLSAEATETLNMKEGELKASEEKLKEASDEMNKANNTRLQLISEINSKYSTYLGYMLSEKTAAEQVASAHQLIIAALKEEMIQKSMNRRQDAINNIYDKQLQDYSTESENELRGIPLQSQQRIMDNFRRVLTSISYNAGTRTYSRFAVEGLSGEASGRSEEQLRGDLRVLLRKIVQQEVADKNGKITNSNLWARGIQNIDDYINSIWGGFMDDGFGTWVDTYMSREAESAKAFRDVNIESETAHKHSVESAVKDIESNANAITQIITDNQKLTDDNIRMLAQHANAVTANLQNYEGEIADVEKYMGKGKDVSLANAVETLFADLDATTRKRILTVAQKQGKVGTPGTGTGDVSTNITSPWGAPPEATSTDYASWDVLELVARRNQMNKFKNVLKPGVDVKAVLAEDKALMKAFEGREVTWEEALKWYNQERLKIQQELKSERFSTNEGNWRDKATKKGRKRVNPLAESDYALAELDRYYSRRKEALEKAREQENMSEELYNRQVELLEQEHLERRSKLRATFTEEVSKDEIKTFRQWWANLEKQDELDNVPWSTVESEWSKATAAQIGRNNLRMQQDLTKQQEITVKHLNAIADIIAKERPYDGITQNLQANLTKMDILLADMLDTSKYTPAEMVNEANKRLSFLLGESEKAYALTAEQLMADMGEKGFKAWADALTSDENGEELTRQLLAQLQKTYDAVQEAIKKEASLIKKQVEIQWNNTKTPSGQSQKQMYEGALSALGLMEDQVKRANQLIGAGYASERVADKLAIKQMQIRLAMQAQYYNLIRKTGEERIAQLQAQGKLEDAEHLKKSLDLSLSEEQKKLDEQRVAIQNQLEESQNRLYKELKLWAEMIGASLQSVFEASHAGDKEYYNERAKLDLTGKGGPGAGTYIIIDNEGTSDAKAHYEYLDEREALERQREIERQNALAEAWRKVMDDINMKMSETITDQVNAMMQNQSIDANTQAVIKNTEALAGMTSALGEKGGSVNIPSLAGAGNLLNGAIPTGEGGEKNETGVESGAKKTPIIEVEPLQNMEWEGSNGFSSTSPYINPNQEGADFWQWDGAAEAAAASAASQVDSINKVQTALDQQFHQQLQGTKDTNDAIKKSTQSTFAAMTQAANLYGVAYQAMSNDNLDTSQKFQMIALQAAGNAAISGLTAALASDTAETTSSMPAILAKCLKIDPIWGSVLFGALTATLGGLMGLATSKIAKSKSTIAQVTGASASAGRLATGMLTYAEGNVNEFSDPKSLTPGRMYDVDAADGHTYRARYMGDKPRTHLTNGPEFHLSGEKGREMIIDAGTTRQITMNEGEIWRAIQTLSGGGRLRHSVRRGRGMANFADGNVEEFEEMENGSGVTVNGSGFSLGMMTQMQASLDRNSEVLERALREGFKGVFDVYGKGGLVDSYDTGKRTVNRYGERY